MLTPDEVEGSRGPHGTTIGWETNQKNKFQPLNGCEHLSRGPNLHAAPRQGALVGRDVPASGALGDEARPARPMFQWGQLS